MTNRLEACAYFCACYIESLVGRRHPLLGGVKLTHACNLACIHCPFHRRKKNSLSFAQTVSSLATLHEWGVRLVIIEGGEPFLWKDANRGLNDVVREARKLFFSVGVTTNGTFPIEVESDIVWVSVDGLKDTHDRIRGRSFDAIVANIERSSHPRVFAHITVNSLNWEEVPRLVEFLAPRVRGITFQFHYPYDGPGDDLLLPAGPRGKVLDELIRLKKQGLPLADSYACMRALKENRWNCRPWLVASVDPDGKLTRGCYVSDRGTIVCGNCGFAAHAEISMAFGGAPGAIAAGTRMFL